MQQLFSRLKFSVPADSYHKMQNELQRWKSRYADLISQYTADQKEKLELREMRDLLE
jgi:hypothetical protein